MKRFWLSLYQDSIDYRPLTYPVADNIKGYWCTGTSNVFDEECSVMCATVDAESEENAFELIKHHWPEYTTDYFRFCELQEPDFKPNDRFPIKDWMNYNNEQDN